MARRVHVEHRAIDAPPASAHDVAIAFVLALDEVRRGFGRCSVIPAKADAGVIAVSRSRVAMVWIEDGGETDAVASSE